ncbi:MAG: hypothetical protein IBX72_14125 [Nitrospirae bacterium]|nr:hypothetical protein [Nitrospirota bacterium]
MRLAIFRGMIKTRTPFFQNAPGRNEKDVRAVCKLAVHNNGSMHMVPIISGNTIRAKIRTGIALDILEKLGPGSLDYATLSFITCGGALKTRSKKEGEREKKIAEVIEALERLTRGNPVASLFGGSTPQRIISGKTITPHAVLVCKEAEPLLPREYYTEESANKYISTEGLRHTRFDRIKTREVFQYLDGEEARELKVKANKEEDQTSLQMVWGIDEYITNGASFYQQIEIEEPTSIEIGAIYSALERFAKNPVIGSFVSKGFGRVAMEYHLILAEAAANEKKDVDIISVTKDGNCKYKDSMGFYKEYKQWLGHVKAQDIVIPDTLR